jgi:hypothetical protein
MSDHARMKDIPWTRRTRLRGDERRATPTLPWFRRATHRLCIALVITSAPIACVKQLPPAPVPPTVAPPLQAAAPPPGGQGRLVVDVVDGPTPVQRIRMASQQVDRGPGRVSYRLLETPELLCATSPCIADVALGNVLLGFPVLGDPGAMEVELVHVGPEPSVYRRALSIYKGKSGGLRVLGIVATAVGGSAVLTGATLLPIGLSDDNRGLTTAGGISLGAGAVLLTLGILAIRHDAPTYRPGSSNHFPLDAARP